jgi:hypothetical protein
MVVSIWVVRHMLLLLLLVCCLALGALLVLLLVPGCPEHVLEPWVNAS